MRRPGPGSEQRCLPLSRRPAGPFGWRYPGAGERGGARAAASRALRASVTFEIVSRFSFPRPWCDCSGPSRTPRPALADKQRSPQLRQPTAGPSSTRGFRGPDRLQNKADPGPSCRLFYLQLSSLLPSLGVWVGSRLGSLGEKSR